jgi:hypothetical protein
MAKPRSYLADDMVYLGISKTFPSADAYMTVFQSSPESTTSLDVKVILLKGEMPQSSMKWKRPNRRDLRRGMAPDTRRQDCPGAGGLRWSSVRGALPLSFGSAWKT